MLNDTLLSPSLLPITLQESPSSPSPINKKDIPSIGLERSQKREFGEIRLQGGMSTEAGQFVEGHLFGLALQGFWCRQADLFRLEAL